MRDKIASHREPDRDDDHTLGWATDTMFGALVGAEPQTVDTYRRDFDTHLRKPLGDLPLQSIKRGEIESVVASMLAGYGRRPGGYSAKTIQNVVRLANASSTTAAVATRRGARSTPPKASNCQRSRTVRTCRT